MLKRTVLASFLLCGLIFPVRAQDEPKPHKMRPSDLPTSGLISQPGPSFIAPHISKHPTIIVYGDQRFTDPSNTHSTDPTVRKWLVEQIAEEKPDAVLLNGDVPLSGDVVNDYQVYKSETKTWRDKHLNVYPALGNHEFHGDPQQALEHWWSAFPAMRNRRWYSVAIGKSIYTITLDSDTSLLPDSDQAKWLSVQLNGLPKAVKFVIISLHHPPVADFQTRYNVSHNPRPNEIALRDYLEKVAPTLNAKIIVSAGHIHNYERRLEGGVTYLVSGGGGASPVRVDRAPEDLYQSNDFPNYHYVKFVLEGNALHAQMFRLADANATSPSWQIRDDFTIKAK
ncbi:MAG TPA: metallophosphoesterase [Terracidiphilus sp.]|nr:metallophosphoesterase [Terracidiphilus sp.]